ncbi:hypothetical protein BJX64DRAFT_292611 [Aspergillus heterothallicus]
MALSSIFDPQYTCTSPTTFYINQSYWSWLKNTGREFTINTLTDPSSSPLFTVETRMSGKYRVLKDRQGTPLCNLHRNFTKPKDAWVLTRGEGARNRRRSLCIMGGLRGLRGSWISTSMGLH